MKRVALQFVVGSLWLCVLWLAAAGQSAVTREIEWADLPVALHPWLKEQGITPEMFAAYRQRLRSETAAREEQGEFEHLIYFALQSRRFTTLASLEPALSAQAFAQSLTPAERASWLNEAASFKLAPERLPAAVRQRLQAFARSLSVKTSDERMLYFQQFTRALPKEKLALMLNQAYVRTMRFLYQKEFAAAPSAAEIAALYQTRGHSTDTQIEANFAVSEALSVLKATQPETQFKRILIVGPGLDFAPRTDLLDDVPPVSYQPFAVADALSQLKLAELGHLQIDCADINARVLAHLQQLPKQTVYPLQFFSGLRERADRPLSEDFKRYFNQLGLALGTTQNIVPPEALRGHLGKRVEVRPAVSTAIRAFALNVVLERLTSVPAYDLIIATNVFPYFNDVELALALTNLTKLLAETGYLVHNERRVTAPAISQALAIPLQQSRTVLIADGQGESLYDFVAVHQKKKR